MHKEVSFTNGAELHGFANSPEDDPCENSGRTLSRQERQSTDSRIIFSSGQGTGSSCSINHPTELISQQWLEKQFFESKFYGHQQQQKSACSSFNSKASRRKLAHNYITEGLGTRVSLLPVYNYFTSPYASPYSK